MNCEPYHGDACPLDPDDFAIFLESTFYTDKERSFLTNRFLIETIPYFTETELIDVLDSLANLRTSDEEGYILELFKYSSNTLRQELLEYFNRILRHG